MDNLPALIHQLEYLFLKEIIMGLRGGTITIKQAKQCANDFLAREPFTTMDDAYAKTLEFVNQHPEFIELKNYLDAFEKEKDVPAKINKMREHMKANNIEAAIQVAKE